MAYTYSYEKMGLGADKSPLDLVFDVVNNHNDWVIEKTEYDNNGKLIYLWVKSVNTTSGQILGLVFRNYFVDEIEVAYSRDIDTNEPWDQQPGAPTDGNTREGTFASYDYLTYWGKSLSPTYTTVIISRDLIHVVWSGGHMDSGGPYQINVMYCALDKTHNYSDGVLWVTSHKAAKSNFGIHFNGHWYQEGFGINNSLEGLQGRLNDLSNSVMHEHNQRPYGMYVDPIAVHCNTDQSTMDAALELIGFLPGGCYGANYYSYPNLLIQEKIDSKEYVGLPTSHIPYINTILYPLS